MSVTLRSPWCTLISRFWDDGSRGWWCERGLDRYFWLPHDGRIRAVVTADPHPESVEFGIDRSGDFWFDLCGFRQRPNLCYSWEQLLRSWPHRGGYVYFEAEDL